MQLIRERLQDSSLLGNFACCVTMDGSARIAVTGWSDLPVSVTCRPLPLLPAQLLLGTTVTEGHLNCSHSCAADSSLAFGYNSTNLLAFV